MSRSYKKYPSAGDNDKYYKRYYNKVIRKTPFNEDLNGGRYKKKTVKWNIMESRMFRCVRWEDFVCDPKETETEKRIKYHRWFLMK